MLNLPTTALVLISGNNFRPAGDLWRRLLTCRIDAKLEAPERRSFAIEPFDYCRNNRQQLVAAALTLLRGFVAAGSPRITSDRLASYERWDDRIRQAVTWIGQQGIMPPNAAVGDPVEVIERAKRAEPERAKLSALLAAVHALKGDSPWRVANLIGLSKGEEDGVKAAILRDALEEIAGQRGDINRHKLGRWIEKQVERHCDGMWIERAGVRWKTIVWRVKGTPAPEPENAA
jgi:hypothetical protein